MTYEAQLAVSATRAIQDKLPGNVAAAVIEFITGSLRTNPRRGAFRIIYSVDDAENLITVLRIEHRADAYRPR